MTETPEQARQRIAQEAVKRYETLPTVTRELNDMAREQAAAEARFILNPVWPSS